MAALASQKTAQAVARRFGNLSGAGYLFLSLPILGMAIFILPRFDGLYGQDPYAYFDYATGPLIESMLALQPPPSFFWPPGYPLLVGLVSRLLGSIPLAGQLVSLMAGALVPVLTALLARELWGHEGSARLVPLLAGLLTAFVGQLWQSSVVVMADTTGLAAATLSLWMLARYSRRDNGHLVWLALAAGAMAFAVLSRWSYALVAVPCTAYALVVLARRPRLTAIGHAAVAGSIAAVVLSPVLVPALQLLFAPSAEPSAFVGDLQVYTWNPLNALRRTFLTADGRLHYRLPNGIYYALAPAHRFYFTPLLAVLILPGFWTVVSRRRAAPVFLLVGWAGVVFAFHAGAPWQNFRFTLAYLPPLAILAAIGGASIIRWVQDQHHWILGAVLAIGLSWMLYGGWTLTQRFVDQKSGDLATVRWVEAQVPPEARLLTFGITLTVQHYSELETFELYDLNSDEMAATLEDGRPTFLLIDVTNVERQWQGHPPADNYHWLRDGPGLTALGRHRNYTLFRVE